METAKFLLGIGLAVVVVFAASAVYMNLQKNMPENPDRDVLYQVSTIDALMQGAFGGIQTTRELSEHGDFGIGTFDGLEGEMIVLDGIVYQAMADGRIARAADSATTPFATVTWFAGDLSAITDQPMNLSSFSTTMEKRLPSGNMVYAVRMHGTFPSMKVRSIPKQDEPYPTLSQAVKNQSVYTYAGTTGTVVGFYTPVFFRGLNVAGYHLHYLSDDRVAGGHILDFEIPAGTTVEYDITPQFSMALPTRGAFTGIDLSQDVSSELAAIEK